MTEELLDSLPGEVEVVLSWAIGGAEVRRWRAVPRSAFLDSVVTEEFLDNLPGVTAIVLGQKRLRRPLHIELWRCMQGGQDRLLLGVVQTHAFKDNECDLVPYLCTDGETAVRVPELKVRFAFPKGKRERFTHGFHAMVNGFGNKSKAHIGRQVVDLMRRGLPSCVLRRKVGLFFSDINGDDSPLAIRCVLVVHGSGDMLLRMDLRWFTMVDDDAIAADVKAAVNLIYHASF